MIRLVEVSNTSPSQSRVSRVFLRLLPVAGLVIAGACGWALTREPQQRSARAGTLEFRSAPLFELRDQNSRVFRLDRYIGRHSILLVFFDGKQGVEADPHLQIALKHHDAIESAGTKVVAVTTTLPQQNRSEIEIPFDVVTDLPLGDGRAGPVHEAWGATDEDGKPRPTVFVIHRDSRVAWDGGHPLPIENPKEAFFAAIEGHKPESVQ